MIYTSIGNLIYIVKQETILKICSILDRLGLIEIEELE